MRAKRRPKVERACAYCGNYFWVWPSRLDIGKGRFCSTSCGKREHFNRFWVDGTRKSQGYIKIYDPSHPFKDKKNYVPQHRLTMEKHLGRYLKPEEVIHHIDGDRSNNRITNLLLCANQSEHIKIHRHLSDKPRFATAKVQNA